MIRIMQVLTDTNIGGAGIWLLNFLQSYDRNEFDIVVVVPSGALLNDRIAALGVRIINADTIADESFSIASLKEMADIIKREKPDIIHTHASLSARIAAKAAGIKAVHTRHCIEGKKTFPKSIIYRFVNNLLSTRVIAVSEAVRRNLTDDGINQQKLSTVYNGITPLGKTSPRERLDAKKRFGIPAERITVGLVARLEKVKNPVLFVEAAKLVLNKYPETHFLLAGEGSLREETESHMESISDNMILTGYITDIENAYKAMDILTLTSDSEALSISLIEGQSTGLAVISTDSGGPGEIIQNGSNGIIVPTGDENALAEAIIKLIESPALREEMGQRGLRIVNEKFRADKMAEKIQNIYKEISRPKERND